MPKFLTETQIAQYHDDGFLAPLRIMSAADAHKLRTHLEHVEEAMGGRLEGDFHHKPHLLFAWLGDLVRQSRVLDAVEDLYGPDLLCWSASFFIKEKESPSFVSWHQDSTYWGLNKPDVITAWVAFTPANAGNGAMEVIPGSHKFDQVPHRDTFAKHNMLTRGQEVAVDVDEKQAVRLDLEPGEMSLHHVRLVHGSPPNLSDDRRIGFAIRYIPTSVRQIEGEDSASLVRGEDRFGFFDLEPRPRADMAPEMVVVHKKSASRHAKILYRGTGVESYNDPRAAGVR